MCVCSAINKESKPCSSIAVARTPGAIPSSVTNVEMPHFASLLCHTLARSFLTDTPLLATTWVYLSLSFALGSVPSREDLSSLPVMVLIFGGGVLVVGLVRVGPDSVLIATLNDLFTLAAGLYALPAAV